MLEEVVEKLLPQQRQPSGDPLDEHPLTTAAITARLYCRPRLILAGGAATTLAAIMMDLRAGYDRELVDGSTVDRDGLFQLAAEIAATGGGTGDRIGESGGSGCGPSRLSAGGGGVTALRRRFCWLTEKRAATLAAGATILAAAMQVCINHMRLAIPPYRQPLLIGAIAIH